MARRVTVYDIAKRLDISPSTVSRVLNKSALIGSEKRELILRTAEEMGYEKRNIRRHGARSILNIALFLPHASMAYQHLFYDAAELIASIERGFTDVRINILTSLNAEDSIVFTHKKLGDIDGCIFAFTEPDGGLAEAIAERDIPAVVLNRIEEERDFVTCDNHLGMHRLLEHLSACRDDARPCYIGFTPAVPVTTYREEGFRSACVSLDRSCRSGAVRRIDTLDQIDEGFVRSIVADGYNAVMCFNDFVAVYFYQAALAAGLRIPEDLALTGFDNSPVRRLAVKRIDTITLSTGRLGEEAGRWLRSRIIDKSTDRLGLSVEGELIEGETVCIR
ncbi:MAG: LacI family DNA-binding transcriptional regulator [Spirochaetaceae bacterium]